MSTTLMLNAAVEPKFVAFLTVFTSRVSETRNCVRPYKDDMDNAVINRISLYREQKLPGRRPS